MEKQLLNNPDIFPSDAVIQTALGESFTAYIAFMGAVTDSGLQTEWRYYNDGKAWLGKIIQKKKTVCWLSIWDAFFKVSFFFTEKTQVGIGELPISEALKNQMSTAKLVGRLVPLVLSVHDISQIADVVAILEYKKALR